MTAGTEAGCDVVAAAWTGRPGCITLWQAQALLSAAQWASMSARDLATLVVKVTGTERPEEITPDDFADVMDRFVVVGFRHPLAPTITAAQLAALDAARRGAGLDARTFVRALRDVLGVRSRRQLDGLGFAYAMEWLARLGARVPLPGHGYITRPMARLVHEAAYERDMDHAVFREHLVRIGGVLRAGDLDRRGFMRLLIAFDNLGIPATEPAPVVEAAPGMVTQAQANLIWRGWLDFDRWKGDTSPAALDAAIGSMFGMEGGLASLTRAGARAVIDRFMAPRLNDRQAAERAGRPPDAKAQAKRDRASRRLERRQRKGGRR